MSIDLVGEFLSTRNGYGRARGTVPSQGKTRPDGGPWLLAGKGVPLTTWGDIVVATTHLRKYAAPDRADCIELIMKHLGKNHFDAETMCKAGSAGSPSRFVKTPEYETALHQFDSVSPIDAFGPFTTARGIVANEVYPLNEEFWGAAQRLAIARSAAGTVPFWSEVVIESVLEAIDEAPALVANAFKAIDPRQYLPDPNPIIAILKWGSVAGGLYLLYKVLEPEKAQR